jgi:hypothetical protein
VTPFAGIVRPPSRTMSRFSRGVQRLLLDLQAGESSHEPPAFPEPEYRSKPALTAEMHLGK